jgi:hypothetical protein
VRRYYVTVKSVFRYTDGTPVPPTEATASFNLYGDTLHNAFETNIGSALSRAMNVIVWLNTNTTGGRPNLGRVLLGER